MKKSMLLYGVVALIAIVITFVFLTTTRFSVIMEYDGNSETVVKDVSLKQYSEISGDLREAYDEMSEIAYDSHATDEGNMLSQISVAFGAARVLSFSVMILPIFGIFIAIYKLIKFVFSFIIPKKWKIYKRFDFSYNDSLILFHAPVYFFIITLLDATLSAHIAGWLMSLVIQKMSVHVVYTSGIDYIWGALMIGVVMLIGIFVAQCFKKDENQQKKFIQEKL